MLIIWFNSFINYFRFKRACFIPKFYWKMSKLNNKDILYNVYKIFEELYDFSQLTRRTEESRKTIWKVKKSLYSCLFVNRLWCKTIVPILWSNPWKFFIPCPKCMSLFKMMISFLPEESLSFLLSQGINLFSFLYENPLFDYISYIRNLQFCTIGNCLCFGISSKDINFIL